MFCHTRKILSPVAPTLIYLSFRYNIQISTATQRPSSVSASITPAVATKFAAS